MLHTSEHKFQKLNFFYTFNCKELITRRKRERKRERELQSFFILFGWDLEDFRLTG